MPLNLTSVLAIVMAWVAAFLSYRLRFAARLDSLKNGRIALAVRETTRAPLQSKRNVYVIYT